MTAQQVMESADPRDTFGDEAASVRLSDLPSDLTARLKLSLMLGNINKAVRENGAAQSARCDDLEAQIRKLEAMVVEQRNWIETMKANGVNL